MSPDDVPSGEMDRNPDIADEEFARFVDDVREAFPAQAPAAEDAHLAAMMETAHPVALLPERRRNEMQNSKIAKWGLRIAAPAAAAFMVMGAMASAGALPRPMQHAASTAAGWAGVDVTNGDDDATETSDPTDTSTDAPDPTTDEGDDSQGDNDNQGDDSQGETNQSDTSSENDQGEDGSSSSSDQGNPGDESSDSSGDGDSGGGD